MKQKTEATAVPAKQAPHLHDELRERLSALRREGREEGPHEGGGRRDHRLAHRLRRDRPAKASWHDSTDFETFFAECTSSSTRTRSLITGLICGVRVEEIEEPVDARDPLSRQARRRTGAGQEDGEDPARLKGGSTLASEQLPYWGPQQRSRSPARWRCYLCLDLPSRADALSDQTAGDVAKSRACHSRQKRVHSQNPGFELGGEIIRRRHHPRRRIVCVQHGGTR